MSEQVQSIIEAVRGLTPEQRRELMAALATVAEPAESERDRERLVQTIRGKYRQVPTSVEDFLRRKREEVERESQP